MACDDIIRKCGRLICLLDLVPLLKEFDFKLVYDLAVILGVFAQRQIAQEKLRLDELAPPNHVNAADFDKIAEMAVAIDCPVTAACARRAKAAADETLAYAMLPEHNWPIKLTVRTQSDLTKLERILEQAGKWDETLRGLINEQAECMRQLRLAFSDETSAIKFFHLERPLTTYWVNPTSGWEEIISTLDKSPNAQRLSNSTAEEQIIEAGKCLAMGRGTACIIHLQNVLELPPRFHPGKKSEIDDWIVAINKYVESTPIPSDASQWGSVSACCAAVRGAWRHPAVHASMIFTEEAAYETYIAIRRLMAEVIKL